MQVVEELRTELPHLKRFATLSPITTFRAWLGRAADLVGCVDEPFGLKRLLDKPDEPNWIEDDSVLGVSLAENDSLYLHGEGLLPNDRID